MLGPYWQLLGTFRVEGTTLAVELSDAADGIVMADAVRVEEVSEIPPPWIANDTAPVGVPLFETVQTNTAQIDTNLTDTPVGPSGAWQTVSAESADEGSLQYLLPGDEAGKFTWKFDNLEPGMRHVVLVSWSSHTDGAAMGLVDASGLSDRSIFARQAAYTLNDGASLSETVYLDQQQSEPLGEGYPHWDYLGTFPIGSNRLGWWSSFSRTPKGSSWPTRWRSFPYRIRRRSRRRQARRQAHCPRSSPRRPRLCRTTRTTVV